MRYSLEETVGEQAFIYLDKVHSPIFMIHKSGSIKKLNRAAKKFLSYAHISLQQIEDYIRVSKIPTITTRKNRLKVFKSSLRHTDYVLIEIVR